MNKYLILILLVLNMACSNKKPKETVIKGVFPNYNDTIVYFRYNGLTDTLVLDKEKSFIHKVYIDKPNYYTIKLQNAILDFYAKPKDTIIVSLDCAYEQNQPLFRGGYADINNYLQHSNKIIENFYNNWDSEPENNKPFNSRLDSLEKTLNTVLDSAFVKDQEIKDLERYRIGYFIKKKKVERIEFNAQRQRKKINHSTEDYTFMEDLDINNSSHLMFDDYVLDIEKYMKHLFLKNKNTENDSKTALNNEKVDYFAFINTTISNQDVRDLIKMKSLMDDMEFDTFLKEINAINKYLSECQNKSYKSVVWNSYRKLCFSQFESSVSNICHKSFHYYFDNHMNEDFLDFWEYYYDFIENYYDLKTIEGFFAFIDDKIENRTLRELIKTEKLRGNLQYGKFYNYGEILNKYLSDCQNTAYKLSVVDLYNKRMLLAPGKKAPEFKHKDINGKEYTLQDFKGNLLYMDIWGMS